MALYHGGENDIEFVSSSPTLKNPSPILKDVDLEEVLMGYLNISRAPFTNLVTFKRICMMRFKSLVEGTQTFQHLAFTSVSQENLDEIDKICKEIQGWLPCMTILYDGKEQILIVKLMVGVKHVCVAHEFACMFNLKLLDLYICRSILTIGLARFGHPSNKSKEIDVSYKPHSCGLEDDWPSFVIEVGVSRSYVMFYVDVAHWSPIMMGKLAQ